MPPLLEGAPQDVLLHRAIAAYRAHLEPASLALFRASVAAAVRSPKLSSRVHEFRAQAVKPFADQLAHFAAEGHILIDHPFDAALRFGGLAVGGLRFMMGGEALGDEELEAHGRWVVDIFLHGRGRRDLARNRARMPMSRQRVRLAAPLKSGDRATRLSPDAWHHIYWVAAETFAHDGYRKASIERISRATGIARTTLYRRHPTKDDFLTRSLCYRVKAIGWRRPQSATDPDCVRSSLQTAGEDIIAAFLAPEITRLHKQLLVEAGLRAAFSTVVYQCLVEGMKDQLAPLFADLHEAGILASGDPRQDAETFFILTTLAGRMLFVAPTSSSDRTTMARLAAETFLFGVARSRKGERF